MNMVPKTSFPNFMKDPRLHSTYQERKVKQIIIIPNVSRNNKTKF